MIINALARFFLFAAITCMAAIAQANVASVLPLESAPDRLEVAPWLSVLPEQLATLDSTQLLTHADHLPWQPLDQYVLAKGYRTEGLWLRLRFRNDGLAQRRILELARANLGFIEVITRRENGSWQIRHAGTSALLPRGDINGLGYSFDLSVPTGNSTLYLHLRSGYPLATPIRLSTENALFRAAQNSAGFFGAGLGLLGGLLLGMTGLRSARLSIPARWIFVAIVTMVILRALADRGVVGYWWLDVPGSLHSLIQFSGSLLNIAHALLCRQFLIERGTLGARMQPVLWMLILANLIWMLASVAWLPEQCLPLADSLRWLGLIAITAALWQPAQQRLAGARLYRAIMLTALIGQLLNDATLRGWLPFVAEPYQALMLWHLFAMPLLLHALERPVTKSRVLVKAPDTTSEPQIANMTTLLPSSLRAQAHVLVVEDNPWVQQVLAGLLLKLDCRTTLAGDGREAIRRLQAEAFDLVLMDCDLPELDGFSTTQLWRAGEMQRTNATARQVPIIAITAHVSAYHELQAREAGMDDFMQKPIDMRALHDILMRWLPRQAH